MVAGASLVCSVESTKWPVSAALTAISAVSKSRISPTMMMSGSCRRNARRAVAKFSPISSCICTWLMPCRLYSTGSSAVLMFAPALFRSDERRVERGRLARAGRARDQHHAPGLVDGPLEVVERLLVEAELRHVELQVRLVEQPQDDLLAPHRRQHRDAEVHLAALAELQLDAAVLRAAGARRCRARS